LNCIGREGEGSLGTRDEFRYMLRNCRSNEEAPYYAYPVRTPSCAGSGATCHNWGSDDGMLSESENGNADRTWPCSARLGRSSRPDSLSSLVRSEHSVARLAIRGPLDQRYRVSAKRSPWHTSRIYEKTLPENPPLDQVDPRGSKCLPSLWSKLFQFSATFL